MASRTIVVAATALLNLALSQMLMSQTVTPAPTGNALNGTNSYPGPSLINYPPKDTVETRIDSFIGDWHESYPRLLHGGLVVRDILKPGDNFQPQARSAVLQYAGGLSYVSLAPHASTVLSRLSTEQEVFYINSGSGTITAAGKTSELHQDFAMLIPANLDFTIKNTADEMLTMYLVVDPLTPGFHPRSDVLVINAETAHLRTPAPVATFAAGIGDVGNKIEGGKVADPYISPGASGHWAHVVRELFAQRDGLSTLFMVITVTINPLTMGEPHPHRPGQEELWLAMRGTSLSMIGSQLRMFRPGMAYMPRPDAEMTHSNINFGTEPDLLLYVVNSRAAGPIKP
jgi:mannose-6-phosphate isomerase-like protein (cupin superfamily)